ncbi:HTTM domain-containing protein [Neolewinella lacunae]|uniref:HTTM domain-containing protein n=1 Tax=Neolewinella lacunae TaxID=1517758 RepID=A0A923T7A6_9BACT|nr:HTTM domain-containing protein [Neolewinella lacunae]MBC6993386.1 HTTM domain-containing protein [Neolewinella lacunae]MDN3635156.1 HTTM domain-containing protein [Neolewinella lacunae]
MGRRSLSAAPLAVFRIGFGLMMLLSVVRFWAKGWIEKLYLEPTYFFSYRYFEWVKPLGNWTYLLFAVVGLSALGILLGWKYRWSSTVFFLSFTYVELMDKSTYLNHYYFVSLLSFLLIWLPAADYFSLDARGRERPTVPAWTIHALQVFVGVVYCYAGLAKLNSDWLLQAQPLAIWLPAKYSLPGLGDLLQQRWVHFAFAWLGAAYDLFIPFLLLWRPTRWLAFGAVVVFHVLTRVLFPIGMFPYIMIVSALIFLDAGVHERIIGYLRTGLGRLGARPQVPGKVVRERNWGLPKTVVCAVLALHLLLPWRYLLYPGELFWTESGYRFSWRVMLMEKAGYLSYRIEDPITGRSRTVDPSRYLTPLQAKQLATQPDFILEFAHHLAREYQQRGQAPPAVYAESYVALNGRGSRPYVNPSVDLTTVTWATPRTAWLLPFEDTIYGL